MRAGARRHGAVAHRLDPDLPAALHEVAAGTPVLLLLNLALPWWPRWHYAVLIGYDLDRHEAVLHSGQQSATAWSLNTLEHTWARSGCWAMLALPPARLPQQTSAADLTRALLAFEAVQGPGATLPGWSTALQRHPEVLALQLGRGNALLALTRNAEAAQQFELAAQQHDSAAAWNNLAISRSRLGQTDAARQALTHALQRARSAEPIWLSAVEQTREELQLGD
jgi:predicted Zn-dependent protease